jgi:uncharacterized protein (UPF0218 family)
MEKLKAPDATRAKSDLFVFPVDASSKVLRNVGTYVTNNCISQKTVIFILNAVKI